MKALLSQCMKYMPVACMKSLMLAHEGWEFDSLALAKFRFINWFTFEYENQVNYSNA